MFAKILPNALDGERYARAGKILPNALDVACHGRAVTLLAGAGEVFSSKSRDYVDAARAAGAGNLNLMFAKILPNALGPAMASGTLLVAQAILIEAGLSYLGLGDPSRVSLGLMLQQAQPIMRSAWWATAFPGLAIFATAITINLIWARD